MCRPAGYLGNDHNTRTEKRHRSTRPKRRCESCRRRPHLKPSPLTVWMHKSCQSRIKLRRKGLGELRRSSKRCINLYYNMRFYILCEVFANILRKGVRSLCAPHERNDAATLRRARSDYCCSSSNGYACGCAACCTDKWPHPYREYSCRAACKTNPGR